MTVPQERRKWWKVQWFADQDTKEERRLITKLDLLIVPYAFLAYWTKYIDQANISESSLQEFQSHYLTATRQCIRLGSER